MDRAFIQCDKTGYPMNPNVFNAFYGLRDLGFECIMFNTYEDLVNHYHARHEPISGGIGMIRRRLQDWNISCDEINYPDELKKYLKRDIWQSTMNTVAAHPDMWPIFVKSVEGKKLTGKVISKIGDLVGCGYCDQDYDVLCSTPLNIVAEWRVFVRYGQVLGVKQYKGTWKSYFDWNVVQNAIDDFKTAPNAYGIDFGVTDTGETVLIEVNDGYALGCYGLDNLRYAKLICTRWAELTDTIDEFYMI